jgi:hypothetical protein
MDKATADSIAKLLRWTLDNLEKLECQILAYKATMLSYPTVVNENLLQGNPYNPADQVKLLENAVAIALANKTLQSGIHQRYEAYRAAIREIPIDEAALQLALKAFQSWSPKTPDHVN